MSESDTEYDEPDRDTIHTVKSIMYDPHYAPMTYKNGKMMCSQKVKKHNGTYKNGKMMCSQKVKKHNGTYKKCNHELVTCDWCYIQLCSSIECSLSYRSSQVGITPPSNKHHMCPDCDTITCRMAGIHHECENHRHYDMVTDHVAIGSYRASYHSFDLVINLDYPTNGVSQGEVSYVLENHRHVIRCGYNDNHEMTREQLQELVTRIDTIAQDTPMRILFHCYAGISRSATVAIAYLSQREHKTTRDTYNIIQPKRPRIQPNSHFMTLLGL